LENASVQESDEADELNEANGESNEADEVDEADGKVDEADGKVDKADGKVADSESDVVSISVSEIEKQKMGLVPIFTGGNAPGVGEESVDRSQYDSYSTTGPIPPQEVIERDLAKEISFQDAASGGASAIPGGATIDNVPYYYWRHGCGPTAVGMVVGYYDAKGYDVISGDAMSQTDAVNQAIASGGDIGAPSPTGSDQHFEDYAMPIDNTSTALLPTRDAFITARRTPHADNCVADYMKTSRSRNLMKYGGSWTRDIGPAFVEYINQQDPTITVSYGYYQPVTWDLLKQEIDNDRPLVFVVDSKGDNSTDHFVTVVGYRIDPVSGAQEYGMHDTWASTGMNIRWEKFLPMGSKQEWGVHGATTFTVGGTATVTCGDNTKEGDEQCDDGNVIPGDGCDESCYLEICGNGRLQNGEECDDGNLVSGDGCDECCHFDAPPIICGNGIIQDGEECDDGNTSPGDGCDGECKIEPEEDDELDASLVITNDWGTTYCARLSVTNGASQPTTSWKVVVDMAGTSLNNAWYVNTTEEAAGQLTLWPVNWNAAIGADSTISSPRFCAARPSGSSAFPSVLSATGIY
jgi:cysteine-rich repeat protein